MPRPFPLPFNVGIDICQISRISKILSANQSRDAMRFIRRVFNAAELENNKTRLRALQDVVDARKAIVKPDDSMLQLATFFAGR